MSKQARRVTTPSLTAVTNRWKKQLADRTPNLIRIGKTIGITLLSIWLVTGEAAALHKPQPCQIPPEFQPLMQLLHDLGSLATVAGIGLGALGIIVAGILIAAPDPNNTQRGKSVAKSSGIGVVLLLSAGMVIAFLVNSLPPTLC